MFNKLGNDEILLQVEVRYGGFEVSLQEWIEQEMYKQPQLSIRAIRDCHNHNLPMSVIPEAYRPKQVSFPRNNDASGALSQRLRDLIKRRGF